MKGKSTRKRNVACVNIATGKYKDMWLSLAPKLDANFFPNDNLRIHVFTDEPEYLKDVKLERASLIINKIPPYGWPEATLFRYAMIRDASDQFDEEIIAYLDDDMDILKPMGDDLRVENWTGGIACVEHPGFHRPAGFLSKIKKLGHPKIVIQDLAWRIQGQKYPGTWENRPELTAFVPRKNRSKYVHGAFWLGERQAILKMCDNLASDVEIDYALGNLAVWLDESHLNSYVAANAVTTLGCEYSSIAGIWQTEKVDPYLISLDKANL